VDSDWQGGLGWAVLVLGSPCGSSWVAGGLGLALLVLGSPCGGSWVGGGLGLEGGLGLARWIGITSVGAGVSRWASVGAGVSWWE